MLRLIVIFSILLLLVSGQYACFSQDVSRESQLALEYFKNKEYEKAAPLYDKLFTQTSSAVYFEYLIKCYIASEDFKQAEKTIKKQIKHSPGSLEYLVELGFLYGEEKNERDKIKQYDLAIEQISSDNAQIQNLANAFIKKNEYGYAESAYLKGRKELWGNYNFHIELASLYRAQRQFDKMIDEYLELLSESEGYIQSVQNNLQAAVYSDVDNNLNDVLKQRLIVYIQNYPEKTIFVELLIWQYLQEEDFQKAMVQSKALDKRNKEDGDRVIAIGKMAAENLNYVVASECFKYVVEMGQDSPNYTFARNEYISVLYKKVFNSNYTGADLVALETKYKEGIIELGNYPETFNLILDLSHLQGFYLNNVDDAIARMKLALDINNLKPNQIALGKIELGDLLLLYGDIYEAILYYGQVEKANPESPVGHEAKLKKAKLAYYSGDFKWAQAQLDVLKASTSKLIANDAFELSQLINDNTALDTSVTAMEIFARGDLLLFRNQGNLALVTFDSILTISKTHSLADEILLRKANLMKKDHNYLKAAEYYQAIIDNYSYDILGDDATYYLAYLYEKNLNNKEKAKELYKNILVNYPGSIYIVDARKKYRILRGDQIEDDGLFFYNPDVNP